MDAHKEIANDIREYLSKGIRLGILLNPRTPEGFYTNNRSISSKYSFFSDEKDYLSNYHLKYEQNEYFVAFEDGAFLQINYEFELKRKREIFIKKINLCYLPPVDELGIIKNEYIRFDYDNSTDNSFFHSFAHMHIGFSKSFRMPIEEVFYFSEFLAFILYLFYPEQFSLMFGKKYITTNTLQESGYGKLTQSMVLTKELEQFFYLAIPKTN